jgi:hypothetical protein
MRRRPDVLSDASCSSWCPLDLGKHLSIVSVCTSARPTPPPPVSVASAVTNQGFSAGLHAGEARPGRPCPRGQAPEAARQPSERILIGHIHAMRSISQSVSSRSWADRLVSWLSVRYRGCPFDLARRWHGRRERSASDRLRGWSSRQATLQVDVAELVDRTGLAKHPALLMGVGEKTHQSPRKAAP